MTEFNEPWKVNVVETAILIDGNGFDEIAGMRGLPDWPAQQANAERIVACVNACRGIPTIELVRCCRDEANRLAELMKAANVAAAG